MRILVVEDEIKLAAHIARALQNDGHLAHVVHDGKVALIEARDGNYDLILLDVELPRMDGLEVLANLRASGVTSRVLMLTARAETPDKIAGLTGGADDYLTKPFAMREVLARINALGRRSVVPTGRTLQVADLILELDDREARRGDRQIELSEREFSLLAVLMREPGRVFSRAELCERVWQREHEYDTKLVEVFIGKLRKKIDDEGEEPLIHTVRYLGYTLRDGAAT